MKENGEEIYVKKLSTRIFTQTEAKRNTAAGIVTSGNQCSYFVLVLYELAVPISLVIQSVSHSEAQGLAMSVNENDIW